MGKTLFKKKEVWYSCKHFGLLDSPVDHENTPPSNRFSEYRLWAGGLLPILTFCINSRKLNNLVVRVCTNYSELLLSPRRPFVGKSGHVSSGR